MKELPSVVREYLLKESILILILPLFILFVSFFFSLTLTLFFTSIIVETGLVFYCFLLYLRFKRGDYVTIRGVIELVEKERYFYREMTTLLVRDEKGKYFRIYLKEKDSKRYKAELPVTIYTPQLDTSKVSTVRNYYFISIG